MRKPFVFPDFRRTLITDSFGKDWISQKPQGLIHMSEVQSRDKELAV